MDSHNTYVRCPKCGQINSFNTETGATGDKILLSHLVRHCKEVIMTVANTLSLAIKMLLSESPWLWRQCKLLPICRILLRWQGYDGMGTLRCS